MNIIMNRKLILVITCLSCSLLFVEIHTMSYLVRFKRYLTRPVGRLKRAGPIQKRFLVGKTTRPTQSKGILKTRESFDKTTLWSWITRWWRGESEEKKIQSAVMRPNNIISFEAHVNDWDETEQHFLITLKSPQYRLLSYLEKKSFSNVIQEISQKVDENISLETKRLMANYLSYIAQKINTETIVQGFAKVEALKILPALLYIWTQQIKRQEDGHISLMEYLSHQGYEIPITLLPVKKFYPILYAGLSRPSPIMLAFKDDTQKSLPPSISTFLKTVVQPIVLTMNIAEHNKTEFAAALWKLCHHEEYSHLFHQNEIFTVQDYYYSTTSLTSDNANTLWRTTDGNKRSHFFTFNDPSLNTKWPYIYSVNQNNIKDKEAYQDSINILTNGQQLTIRPETKTVAIDLAYIKENSIYTNIKFLEEVEELVKEYTNIK